MEIKETKTLSLNQVSQGYKKDIQTLMNFLLELGLSSYPIEVNIQKYRDIDEISYIEVEFIKDVARFHYSFGVNGEFHSAILFNGTMFEKMYTTRDKMDGESDEMY